jgi:MFS family permease
VGLGLTGLFMHWSWFAFTLLIWTAGEIAGFSPLMAFLMDWAPPHARAQYLSYNQATWRLAGALNPLIFITLHSKMSEPLFWAVEACLMLPAILMVLWVDRKWDRPENLRGLSA